MANLQLAECSASGRLSTQVETLLWQQPSEHNKKCVNEFYQRL
jgi:hypothetical protein